MSSRLAANWDLALTSSALLLIVGGLVAPHVRRLVSTRARDPRSFAG